MKESSVYQAIIAEGRAEGNLQGIRTTLVFQARPRFGEPGEDIRAALDAITDEARLLDLVARLPSATNWHDLLGIKPKKPLKKGTQSK